MAHFSEYQVRRFRFIFNQYSEDAIGEADVETDPFADIHRTFATRQNPFGRDETPTMWKLKFNYRLTASELFALMPRLGPEMSMEQIKMFLYTYDTSCTGALDFEDFIEFLADYQATLAQKRDKALTHYNSQYQKVVVSRHFISAYPEANMYLAASALDDPEFFFTKQESLTNDIISSDHLEDMSVLRRKIIFRVSDYSERFKKRVKKGIEFQSLDAVVRVECAGIVQETTAVISSLKPEWDQDLTINITIPPGEIQDVQQWVDRQVIQISLLDYEDSGLVPHTELISTAYIPLIRVLLSARKPIWTVLRLSPPDCVTRESELPCIEVSIVDCTQERWAWAKVVDAYTYPEEVWQKKHPVKFTTDLKHVKKKPPSRVRFRMFFKPYLFDLKGSKQSKRRASMNDDHDSREEDGEDDSNFDVLTQYNQITKPLRVPFKRRTFNTLALDENNTIRPLTSFVRPITMHDECIITPQQAAVAVARIPYQLPIVPRAELSRRLMSQFMSSEEEERIDGGEVPDSLAVAGWPLRNTPQGLATENFFAQIASPQTMLLARRGSLVEHAILLCGLLLGMGFQAYVAIGKVKRRPYVWVVTINPVMERDESQPLDEFAPCNITFECTGNQRPVVFQRRNFKKIKEAMDAQESNKRFKVVHWDPLTDSAPAYVMYSSPTKFDDKTDDKELLTELVDYIQLYRRHSLYIGKTDFHRDASRFLQSQLNRFEATHTTMLGEASQAHPIISSTDPTDPFSTFSPTTGPSPTTQFHHHTMTNVEFKGQGLSLMGKQNRMASGSKGSLFSLALLRDSSMVELDANLFSQVQDGLMGLVPEGHWWRGMVFHFKDADVEAIMDQMGEQQPPLLFH
ncbi:hypothetical protein HDU67_008350 [Dinochytrium kinnereticum]|nr:hypothetical protein HDU67_008350 [Dinochytrium kinnereticum]